MRDQKHFLSAFGACHVGCGQQIDVPNYICLKLILSICLIPRAYNTRGWWGRCQEACWVTEDGNLGIETSMRGKSGQGTAMEKGGLVSLSYPLMASKGWMVLERSLGASSCLEADLPKTVQTGTVATFEAGQLAESKCFCGSKVNFFCCRSKAYFD